MADRTGYLTILSSDGTQIYGEFANANWTQEEEDKGGNHIFTGLASDGTIETFNRLNLDGIENVCFRFEQDGSNYSGAGTLLAPEINRNPSEYWVRVETGSEPTVS